MAPRSLAEKSFNEPINLPMGVRAPATITEVVMTTSKIGCGRPIRPTGEAQSSPSGYRYVMTTDQVDARRVLATSLVTGLDHVGIAVADLDAAIEWYHDHLGMILVHEEVNDDQGIREAMVAVPGAPDSAQIQLMAPLDESSTIAKVPRQARPGHPAAGLSGQRSRRPLPAAARPGGAARLRRPAARHGKLPDQLHPPQGRRRGADRVGRASLVDTSSTFGSDRASRALAQHGVCQCRRSSIAPRDSAGHTTTCAVPGRIW